MIATPEDRIAMRRLLGLGDPHPDLYQSFGHSPLSPSRVGPTTPLVGVEQCTHALSGSGELLVATNPNVNEQVIETWRRHPYHHHEFTLNPNVKPGGHERCYCRNGQGGKVHVRCWLGRVVIQPDGIVIDGDGALILNDGERYRLEFSRILECDNCGRADGFHDLTIEH